MKRKRLTDICRIGVENLICDKIALYKRFILDGTPEFATIKLQSEGVFGIFVNGTFVEANKGLLTNRTLFIEITPLLQKGENEVKLISGLHYFQSSTEKGKRARGYNFAFAAAEICVRSGSDKFTLKTNTDWELVCDDAKAKISSFGEVTTAEYDRFWKHAALWRNSSEKHTVPADILKVVGEDYSEYLNAEKIEFVEPLKVLSSNFIPNGSEYAAIETVIGENDNYVLYDFGKVVVGYTVIDYKAGEDTIIKIEYDYNDCYSRYEYCRYDIQAP